MRKGALNDYARQIGCNKVAYAHHMDDIIETMFLSMFYVAIGLTASLLVDLSYGIVDPRIRIGAKK